MIPEKPSNKETDKMISESVCGGGEALCSTNVQKVHRKNTGIVRQN